ncbi:hypothetical protein BDB01DRAFT_872760 [Pilobolus umbonatus]|nr:hypothetical protein BDB01DRAFT_872760 [Pilobolus umbonatus]
MNPNDGVTMDPSKGVASINQDEPSQDVEMEEAPATLVEEVAPRTKGITPKVNTSNKFNNTLEKLISLRAGLLHKVSEIINNSEDGTIDDPDYEKYLENIEKLNHQVGVLEKALKVTSMGGTTSKLIDSGDRINPKDIPKFQLEGVTETYFKGEPQFVSVEHFLRTFEKVIESSGNYLDAVWRRHIPLALIYLALPYDYDAWLKSKLMHCNTWKKAKALFISKFGKNHGREEAIRKVYNSFMGSNETIEEYTNKFLKLLYDAGKSKSEVGMIEKYRTSLYEPCQTQMITVMEARKGLYDEWSINEIATIGRNIFRDKPIGSHFHEAPVKRKLSNSEIPGHQYSKRKNPNGSFFCPRHGGNKANHNASDCLSNNKGKEKGAFLGQKNQSYRATDNYDKPCRYCSRPWKIGHKCQEFYDSKKAHSNDRTVLAIQSSSSEVVEEAQRIEKAMEDVALECKYKDLEKRMIHLD